METPESILKKMTSFRKQDDPERAKSFIQEIETKEIVN